MELALRINRRHRPRYRVIQTPAAFLLLVYLPGVERDELEVRIDVDGATGVAELGVGVGGGGRILLDGAAVRSELRVARSPWGVFRIPRSVVLDGVAARFCQGRGVLAVRMPKSVSSVVDVVASAGEEEEEEVERGDREGEEDDEEGIRKGEGEGPGVQSDEEASVVNADWEDAKSITYASDEDIPPGESEGSDMDDTVYFSEHDEEEEGVLPVPLNDGTDVRYEEEEEEHQLLPLALSDEETKSIVDGEHGDDDEEESSGQREGVPASNEQPGTSGIPEDQNRGLGGKTEDQDDAAVTETPPGPPPPGTITTHGKETGSTRDQPEEDKELKHSPADEPHPDQTKADVYQEEEGGPLPPPEEKDHRPEEAVNGVKPRERLETDDEAPPEVSEKRPTKPDTDREEVEVSSEPPEEQAPKPKQIEVEVHKPTQLVPPMPEETNSSAESKGDHEEADGGMEDPQSQLREPGNHGHEETRPTQQEEEEPSTKTPEGMPSQLKNDRDEPEKLGEPKETLPDVSGKEETASKHSPKDKDPDEQDGESRESSAPPSPPPTSSEDSRNGTSRPTEPEPELPSLPADPELDGSKEDARLPNEAPAEEQEMPSAPAIGHGEPEVSGKEEITSQHSPKDKEPDVRDGDSKESSPPSSPPPVSSEDSRNSASRPTEPEPAPIPEHPSLQPMDPELDGGKEDAELPHEAPTQEQGSSGEEEWTSEEGEGVDDGEEIGETGTPVAMGGGSRRRGRRRRRIVPGGMAPSGLGGVLAGSFLVLSLMVLMLHLVKGKKKARGGGG